MRLIVFFDLPTDTVQEHREYRLFRNYLLKNGYLMMQKSVYVKLAVDGRAATTLVAKLRENCPPEGIVQALQITEKQYACIANIVGRSNGSDAVTDIDSLLII